MLTCPRQWRRASGDSAAGEHWLLWGAVQSSMDVPPPVLCLESQHTKAAVGDCPLLPVPSEEGEQSTSPLSIFSLAGSHWSPHRWDGNFPPILLLHEGVTAHLAASGCWCGSKEREVLVNLSWLCVWGNN